MPEVTIVGEEIAGLTSALRLLQRGFDVTLMEQDNFLGGMLRATLCDDPEWKVRHEHSYHLFTMGIRASITKRCSHGSNSCARLMQWARKRTRERST